MHRARARRRRRVRDHGSQSRDRIHRRLRAHRIQSMQSNRALAAAPLEGETLVRVNECDECEGSTNARVVVVVLIPRPNSSSFRRPRRCVSVVSALDTHARRPTPRRHRSIRTRRGDAGRDGTHTVTSHDPSIDRFHDAPRHVRVRFLICTHHIDTPSRTITRGLSCTHTRSIPPIQSKASRLRLGGTLRTVYTHDPPRSRPHPTPPTPPRF
jgi:hypothetical protein